MTKPVIDQNLQSLDARSRDIFRAIVETYLRDGEPLGSRNLSRMLPASLSPATVRNVMSDLEQLGLVYAPRLARIVRASTLVIRELPFVEAARALGVPGWKIIVRHVLRNLTSPILVQATFVFANAMLAEASLSFLGVGVSPTRAS